MGSGELNNCQSRYNTDGLSSLPRTCLCELQYPTRDAFQAQPVLPLSPVLSAGTVLLLEPRLVLQESNSETKCLKAANSLDVPFGESQLAAIHKDLRVYCDYD